MELNLENMQMQATSYKTEILTDVNIDLLKDVYESFRLISLKEYRFELEPVNFISFRESVLKGILQGFAVFEDDRPAGILIYVMEEHKSVEVNIIHIIDKKELNKKRTALLQALMEHIKDRTDWKVISYALLGFQETFTRDIALLKFQFVGQAMVKFDFSDPVSYKILQKAEVNELPEGYKLEFWDEKYLDSAVELIHLGFKNTKDSNYDPRFLTKEGSKSVIELVTGGVFGHFLPQQTRLLTKDGELEGICFVILGTASKANIPLVSVRKSNRNKGLGKLLLKSVVSGLIKGLSEQQFTINEVNAAVETDNYPAMKMYRRIGFREEYSYPHTYYKNPKYKEA